MDIEIKLDSGVTVPKVIVITDKVDKEIEELVEKISKYKPSVISFPCLWEQASMSRVRRSLSHWWAMKLRLWRYRRFYAG